MRQFKTVFIFEFLGLVKNKMFIISTIIILLISVIIPTIPTLMGVFKDNDSIGNLAQQFSGDGIKNIGVVTNSDNEDLIRESLSNYSVVFEPNLEDAFKELDSKSLDLVLEINADNHKAYVTSIQISNLPTISDIDKAVNKLRISDNLIKAGINSKEAFEIVNINQSAEIIERKSNLAEGSENSPLNTFKNAGIAYVLNFVLYITLLLYGQMVVISVVREKTSKAIELLITSVKPKYLMFGKVLAACSVGLLQLVIILVVANMSLAVNSAFWAKPEIDIPPEVIQMTTSFDPMLIVYFILFYLLGFLFYSFLFAAFASTVSKMEEVNGVMTVPMLGIIIGFVIAIFTLGNTSGVATVVCSYIPFFTPMVMFSRICLGSVQAWEPWLSIVILIISIFGVGIFSAKIFRIGVLMYGKTPKVGEIIKMFFKAKI